MVIRKGFSYKTAGSVCRGDGLSLMPLLMVECIGSTEFVWRLAFIWRTSKTPRKDFEVGMIQYVWDHKKLHATPHFSIFLQGGTSAITSFMWVWSNLKSYNTTLQAWDLQWFQLHIKTLQCLNNGRISAIFQPKLFIWTVLLCKTQSLFIENSLRQKWKNVYQTWL